MKNIAGDFFMFQQDSAPSHTAWETVDLLSQNAPDFISPFLWPPNSPNLNPVDYRIWGLLQELFYATPIRDVEHLKQRLIEEWSRFDQHGVHTVDPDTVDPTTINPGQLIPFTIDTAYN